MSKQRVFLSYCRRENAEEARQLRKDLQGKGFSVWWDQEILAGQDRKFEIRKAMKHSGAVVLCLSKEAEARNKSGIYPEALDAINIYRELKPGNIYLIPVRFSECEIQPIEIDGTRTLDRLHYVDLFPTKMRHIGVKFLTASLRVALQMPNSSEDNPGDTAEVRKTEIEIIINRHIRDYSEEDQNRLLRAIGELLEMGSVRVVKRQPGSVVKLTLVLPPAHAEKLFWAVKAGKFEEYGVLDARLEETHDPAKDPTTSAEDATFVTEEGLKKAQEKMYGSEMQDDTEPILFISYSWADRSIVAQIDQDFKSGGISLVKDTRDLGYKQSIKDFMKRVRDVDYVLMIISDPFLKSSNCMYEVLEFLQSPDHKRRILPIYLNSAKIFDAEERLQYQEYWEDKEQKLEHRLKNLQGLTTSKTSLDELKHYAEIRKNIDTFFEIILDQNIYSYEEIKKDNYKPIFEFIGYEQTNILKIISSINAIEDLEVKEREIESMLLIYDNDKYLVLKKIELMIKLQRIDLVKSLFKGAFKAFPRFGPLFILHGDFLRDAEKDYYLAEKEYLRALEINQFDDNASGKLNLLRLDYLRITPL